MVNLNRRRCDYAAGCGKQSYFSQPGRSHFARLPGWPKQDCLLQPSTRSQSP